jgi:hypothetical protein
MIATYSTLVTAETIAHSRLELHVITVRRLLTARRQPLVPILVSLLRQPPNRLLLWEQQLLAAGCHGDVCDRPGSVASFKSAGSYHSACRRACFRVLPLTAHCHVLNAEVARRVTALGSLHLPPVTRMQWKRGHSFGSTVLFAAKARRSDDFVCQDTACDKAMPLSTAKGNE